MSRLRSSANTAATLRCISDSPWERPSLKEGIPDERRCVNNVLSLYTLISVAVFIVYLSVNPL